MIPALLLAAAARASEPAAPKSEISSNITVRGKAGGPALVVPPPTASRPVVDEVLNSLSLGRGAAAAPEPVRVPADTARFDRPFPRPPFLALSPENIHALYDAWTFEVRADGDELIWKTEGAGRVREPLEWSGAGADGRPVAGRRYRYRFRAERGRRSFLIESEPVRLLSFTRPEYAGETRLEVLVSEIFEPDKDVFAASAKAYIEAMAAGLRNGEPRADGTLALELGSARPGAALTRARAEALAKRFAGALRVAPEKIKVAVLPAERGEAVTALLPPSKGASLKIEP